MTSQMDLSHTSTQPTRGAPQQADRRLCWPGLIAVLLLWAFFAQAVLAIPRLSLTADEPVYIGAGYAFLRSGDLRMATAAQHPPLMQTLVALPLLLRRGPELSTLDGWETAEMGRFAPAFVAWYGDQLDGMTFAARMPVVLIGLLWAAFLFRWAADWFGPWGGVVALTLFVFDPNVLAHATLATNDVGFAAFSFVAAFAAMRFLRRPSWRYVALAGAALGGSLSAKSSGFFTALVLVILFPMGARVADGRRAGRLLGTMGKLALVLLLGFLVLWATYGFERRPLVQGGPSVPLATQWEVWREMGQHLDTGHTAYLNGEISHTGWLGYYPVAFALKTPPLTLALLVVGLVVGLIAALAGGSRRWLAGAPLWVYLGGYGAATLLSNVNTGYRFLLPILPFCFLVIAGLTPALSRRILRIAIVALLSGYVVGAIRLHPHYLVYFNFLAGGPENGHRYLVDSNLDWGQSFHALRAYLERRGIEQVNLSYYTYADPALYGVDYQPLPPATGAPPILSQRFDPPPGVYVLGATTQQGVMVVDPDTFDWFRRREPVGRPGTALFVYQVAPHAHPPTWLAQCTRPRAPLSSEAIAEGFGRDDLRIVHFDCASGWLYPGGTGRDSWGWYTLFRETARSDDPFIQDRLAGGRLSYAQQRAGTLPPFAIYEQTAAPPSPRFTLDVEARVGHLTFIGYALRRSPPIRPGQTIDVETWWRVDSVPQRPLSIMLHLMGSGGHPVLVGDGLGVPIDQWRAGDVLVQRHPLSLPGDAPPGVYTPITGVYWLDTMERWAVEREGRSAETELRLPPLTVTDQGE